MNNNKCSECKYQLICKYISDFKKFEEEIERLRKLLQAEGIDLSIFNTEINCEFFARESKLNPLPTINDLYGSKDDYDMINKQNPCDYCPRKPDPNKMVVGDSPCQWCRHNPFKLTCD